MGVLACLLHGVGVPACQARDLLGFRRVPDLGVQFRWVHLHAASDAVEVVEGSLRAAWELEVLESLHAPAPVEAVITEGEGHAPHPVIQGFELPVNLEVAPVGNHPVQFLRDDLLP